jgi:endonuclease/exonuclease/phosphatase (EEP) superfamily protein YafD
MTPDLIGGVKNANFLNYFSTRQSTISMKKLLFYILILLLASTSIISVLGFFGKSNWILDLFSHFKPQYLIVLIIGTVLIFIIRKRVALFFIPFIFISAYDVVPLYFGGDKHVEITNSTKIVCINLLSSNGQFEDVEQYIKTKSVDIIVLQEFTTLWELMLGPKLHDYPFHLTIPRPDNFGIAVFSKIPFSRLEELNAGDSGIPTITGDFELNNTMITLLATHPLPPVDSENFELRNLQLSELGKIAAASKNEIVLIGDFNTSSFSVHFKKLMKESRLVDSRKGFGLLTTWPTWFYLSRTTLDHCLVSEGIKVIAREVGSDIGSDHLPIFVELGIE